LYSPAKLLFDWLRASEYIGVAELLYNINIHDNYAVCRKQVLFLFERDINIHATEFIDFFWFCMLYYLNMS